MSSLLAEVSSVSGASGTLAACFLLVNGNGLPSGQSGSPGAYSDTVQITLYY